MTDIQQDAPSAPPAGWYADPVRPGATRYWSGLGWTDQVSSPAEEAPPVQTPPSPELLFDVAPVVELPPVTFGAPPAPRDNHATQSDWHQSRVRPLQRTGAPSVSSSLRPSSSASARGGYDRNWISGVALTLAILSIAGLGARVLLDLPPLTQSIFAGAPIGISLLALVRAARGGSGLVVSIIAVLLSAATLAAAWVVDPAIIQGAVDAIFGLLPA